MLSDNISNESIRSRGLGKTTGGGERNVGGIANGNEQMTIRAIFSHVFQRDVTRLCSNNLMDFFQSWCKSIVDSMSTLRVCDSIMPGTNCKVYIELFASS